MVGCVAALVAATAGAASAPALELASRSPVVVTGTGFRAHEHVAVAVAVRGEKTRVARVVTRASGSFRAAFRGLAAPRCSAVAVVATRQNGTHVRLHLMAPGCISPGQAVAPAR